MKWENKKYGTDKRCITGLYMKYLEVDIIEYIQNDFPGWVRCKFIDSVGKEHYFNDKIPVVSVENINEETILPKKGFIRGKIINKNNGIICFSTLELDHIETEDA
jgi:hypothetical protein